MDGKTFPRYLEMLTCTCSRRGLMSSVLVYQSQKPGFVSQVNHQKLRQTIKRVKRIKRDKTVHKPENIVVVAESVREAPSPSIHRCSQQVNISETSLRRIFYKGLGMKP